MEFKYENMAQKIMIIIVSAFILFVFGCKNENEFFYSILKVEDFQKQIDGKQTSMYFFEKWRCTYGNNQLWCTNSRT